MVADRHERHLIAPVDLRLLLWFASLLTAMMVVNADYRQFNCFGAWGMY